jgi:mRNA-degrading endonuclease RelE of RelBE toxin-antitoxin system
MEKQEQKVSLDKSSFEAAVRLLTSQQVKAKPDTRRLLAETMVFISTGVLFSALLNGMITYWTNHWYGIWMFIVAGVFFFIMGVLSFLFPTARNIFRTIYTTKNTDTKTPENEKQEIIKKVTRSIRKHQRRHYLPLFLGLFFFFVWIGGLVWLIYSVAHGNANISATILNFGALVIYYGIIGYTIVRQDLFSSNIDKLKNQFDTITLESKAKNIDTFEIKPKDIAFLGQVEKQKLGMTIKEIPDIENELYFLKKSERVREAVKKFDPEARAEMIEAIESLEIDPEPPSAKAVTEKPGLFTINKGGYTVTYSVDHDKNRIEVFDIEAEDQTGEKK